MRISKKVLVVAAIAGATALALTGCTGSGGGGAATGDPILVNAITDTKAFPEAAAVATAVFEAYNAEGGYNGRPITLKTIDAPTGDAPAAVNGAADSIADASVVAMVGSSTFGECAINHTSYEEAGMVAFVGVGVDTFCFTTPNMAAANNGPLFDIYATAWNAINDGSTAPCMVANAADPSTKYGYEQVVVNLEASTGVKFAAVEIPDANQANDYSTNVLSALANNCDSLIFGGVHPTVAAMIGVLNTQGVNLPVYVQTSCYDPGFPNEPAVLAYPGIVSVPAELAPSDDAANADFQALLDSGAVASGETWSYSFMQAGYLAAKTFIHVLESIDGDVTRESVTAAAQSDAPWPLENPMWGNPWTFGPGATHQANSSVFRADIAPGAGAWESIGPWIQAAEMDWEDIAPTPAGF
jgi:branched-chain amino acid transport system substrate-binding protein